MDPAAFAAECIKAFKKATPIWSPPHGTIFALARKHKLKIKISGMTEAFYTKHAEALFDDLDPRLEKIEVDLGHGQRINFVCTDCRKMHVKEKKHGKRS